MPVRRKHADRDPRSYDYDVCLSFAGEDRAYVRQVADELHKLGVRVFFDEYEQAELWGKDLYTHLDDVYQNAARYCVLFVSKHYSKRVWTNHERESAQARALQENSEYILPGRFDATEIPGLRKTIGYIDLNTTSPSELAQLISKKLGRWSRNKFFPPVPDRLFARVKARSVKARRRVENRARDFFEALTRMTPEEREVVFSCFLYGCPTELPDNIHIRLDLLRRITGFPPNKITRLLRSVRSLGFFTDVLVEEEGRKVVLEWHDMSVDEEIVGNSTGEANAMLEVGTEGYCDDCMMKRLRQLDFSQLASATRSIQEHV